MLNLKIVMLSERSQTHHIIPHIKSSRKCKLAYTDREQISGCIDPRAEVGLYAKWLKKTKVTEMFHTLCNTSFTGVIHLSNITKFYLLNIWKLYIHLYVCKLYLQKVFEKPKSDGGQRWQNNFFLFENTKEKNFIKGNQCVLSNKKQTQT